MSPAILEPSQRQPVQTEHTEQRSWLRRYWALVVAGLLVLFIAGGASMSHYVRVRAVPAAPPVSAPPR